MSPDECGRWHGCAQGIKNNFVVPSKMRKRGPQKDGVMCVCVCVCFTLNMKMNREFSVKRRRNLHLGRKISECEIIIMAGSATEYISIQIYSARTNAYPFIGEANSGTYTQRAHTVQKQWLKNP